MRILRSRRVDLERVSIERHESLELYVNARGMQSHFDGQGLALASPVLPATFRSHVP